MSLPTPRIEIYPERIAFNARSIINLCHSHGARVACVTKAVCAHPTIAQVMAFSGADMLADARLPNLESNSKLGLGLPLMLVRIPALSTAAEVVRLAAYSLNSSFEGLQSLSAAAHTLKVHHQVIIMVDVGDLREGLWPDRVLEVVRQAAGLPNLDVIGLGSNLGCFGGVVPTPENMQLLVGLRDICRRETGLELNTISGGNSANLPLLLSGGMPAEVNHFRVGETLLLGRSVYDRSPWPVTRQDTFRIVAEVLEIGNKPSIPIWRRGPDAFGGSTDFIDRGIRRRAICNIGRQDVHLDGLEPEDPGIIVLGGSSDHLVLDVQDAHFEVCLGGEIAFRPNYGALLAAFTSDFVAKMVVEG